MVNQPNLFLMAYATRIPLMQYIFLPYGIYITAIDDLVRLVKR
jgi:hypothetical protein